MDELPVQRKGLTEPQETSADYTSQVASLPMETTRLFLALAAIRHGDVATMIATEVDKLASMESTKVLDFDDLCVTAWDEMNVKHSTLNGSGQYEMSFNAFDQIVTCLKQIGQQCHPTSSFRTKENGLEACRDIGKTIALPADDVCARECQAHFVGDKTLVNVMMKIARTLTPEERKKMVSSGWCRKIEELVEMSKDDMLFPGLMSVAVFMEGKEVNEMDQ